MLHGNRLRQWDSNRKLELYDPEDVTVSRVEFWRNGMQQPIPIEPDRSTSPPTVAVPNILLQSCEPIIAYECVSETESFQIGRAHV